MPRRGRAPVTAGQMLRMPAAGLRDLHDIREFVRAAATSLQADPDVVPDLVVAVDEAAANVIRHGYGGRPGPLEVEVGRERDTVVVRVRDRAPAFDPTTWPSPDLDAPLALRPVGGLGIHLALASVDRMEHRRRADRGNELTLVVPLRSHGRQA